MGAFHLRPDFRLGGEADGPEKIKAFHFGKPRRSAGQEIDGLVRPEEDTDPAEAGGFFQEPDMPGPEIVEASGDDHVFQ
jgi:hypothetical protein